jgi:AraC family transcriptional regulator
MCQNLQQHNARLLDSVMLENGTGLVSWSNQHDQLSLDGPDHHTLSLYVEDGYESFLKTSYGWKNGGAPDRLCLMPKDYMASWDIRGPLSFVHFYFTDAHLREVAEKVWDKSPAQLSVDEHIFVDDPTVTAIYRQFLLNCQWGDSADRMMMSSAISLLLTHLVKQYTHFKWSPVQVKGGLAPFQLARVKEYIDANLNTGLQLADLAGITSLSEYHFARMFKQSVGLAPHQYVMQQRLIKAKTLLQNSTLPLTDIALQCGFSSSSHFSNNFKRAVGFSPSKYRSR